VGHVARMGETGNFLNFLSENLKGGDHSEELGVDGRIILEWGSADRIHLAQDRDQWLL